MRIPSALVALFLAPAVLAGQGSTSHGADASIGLRFGTLGVGLEANKLLAPHVGARVGFNVFKYNTTKDVEDISFDAQLKLHSVTALLDLYPGARKGFHLSAGVISKPAEFSGVGVPTGSTYDIDDQTYTAAQVGTLNASAEFPSVLPYVGFGFGTAANSHKGLKFVFDLGAGFGQPTLKLTASNAGSSPQLAQSVKNQETKSQADLRKYLKVYPSITLGLAYAF